MGFMDKAKKMAEQAQVKLDEAQKQFNSSPSQPAGGSAVEYDKHGRPIQPEAVTPDAAAPPLATPGVPQTEPAAPASTGPTPDPSAPAPKAPAPPVAAAPGGPPAPDDPNRPSTEAPKLSSGDPLAG
jgi:hypothetical protein